MKARIDKLRKVLVAENIDAALLAILDANDTATAPSVRYLTGYSGSTGAVFVTRKTSTFFSDFRYTDQAKKEVKGSKVIISKKPPIESLADLKEAQVKNLRVAFEANRLTVEQRNNLQKTLPNAILIEKNGMVEELGICKDKFELESIKGAVAISDEAFERILGYMRPGLTEKEVAAELEYQMKMLGAEKQAFDSIVASGYRSAMPHGVASIKKLKKGDLVTLDFGAVVNGYCSDITRTVVLGKATAQQKKIYNLVARAQMAAIRKIKNGADSKAVDGAARKIIEKAGYGKNFGHGTGHGISLEVHAQPRLSPKESKPLKSNMVVTVEPGIYITGWGGVRIEDDVVVRPAGCTVLNKAPKNLLEL
ncbi:MAG: aminopeptidase P family protein [FCB group bacterium]|nr:aminopeptidase P family protein [FCB group bacterium]